MDMTTVIQALEIMVKGMVGIFVAILIIMLCVFIMGKLGTLSTVCWGPLRGKRALPRNPKAKHADFRV